MYKQLMWLWAWARIGSRCELGVWACGMLPRAAGDSLPLFRTCGAMHVAHLCRAWPRTPRCSRSASATANSSRGRMCDRCRMAGCVIVACGVHCSQDDVTLGSDNVAQWLRGTMRRGDSALYTGSRTTVCHPSRPCRPTNPRWQSGKQGYQYAEGPSARDHAERPSGCRVPCSAEERVRGALAAVPLLLIQAAHAGTPFHAGCLAPANRSRKQHPRT